MSDICVETKSDSEVCRENGWSVGTVLEGDEGYGPTRIVITAIGEDKILARELIDGSLETSWTLSCRDWKAIL